MKILIEAKKPFLELLRNITPQVVMLSLAFVVLGEINFSVIDVSNLDLILFFFLLLVMSFAAMLFSMIQFLEDYMCPHTLLLEKFAKRIKRMRSSRWLFGTFPAIFLVLIKKWKISVGVIVPATVVVITVNVASILTSVIAAFRINMAIGGLVF
ncbi:hypothetical protein CO612_08660 [Lysobacteraceae bacterium NML71-0210]|nr:hypothetical protein CO612_08660 [Xanthomonadaceae bacterium NML71-0210]